MADEAKNASPKPDDNAAAPQMPKISIMPKPEPLKVNMTEAKAESKPEESSPSVAPAPAMPKMEKAAESKPAEKPKPEAKPVATAETKEDNVFTQLFGDDKVMQTSDMIETVDKKEKTSKKSIFSKKPSLKSIKKKQADKASKVQSGKIMLRVSLILLALTGGFFYTQNNADFTLLGTNPAQKVAIAEESLVDEQAEVHVQEHLTATLLLDQFSANADAYLYNSAQADSDVNSSNKQEEFAQAAEDSKNEVALLLADAQNYIETSITPDHKVAANTLVSELVEALQGKIGEVDEATLAQDIQDLQTTRSIIQNDSFRSSLAGANLEDLDDDTIEGLFNSYNELNQSTQALIGQIRAGRTQWSKYFSEIETLTKKTDPLFNTEFPGSITLTSIRFENGSISISGETSTDDTKNFTLVSNYIDTLESSSSFTNVEDRSYTKNAGEEDYTGQFRISLDLE